MARTTSRLKKKARKRKAWRKKRAKGVSHAKAAGFKKKKVTRRRTTPRLKRKVKKVKTYRKKRVAKRKIKRVAKPKKVIKRRVTRKPVKRRPKAPPTKSFAKGYQKVRRRRTLKRALRGTYIGSEGGLRRRRTTRTNGDRRILNPKPLPPVPFMPKLLPKRRRLWRVRGRRI